MAGTIGGMTRARLGDGHKPSYYRNGYNGYMEVFAEAYSAIMTGDKDYEQLFPNIVSYVRKELQL